MLFGKMIGTGGDTYPRRTTCSVIAVTLVLLLAGCGAGESDSDGDDSNNLASGLPVETPEPSVGYGALPAISLSDPNFEGDHFSGSGACSVCHNDMIDDEGADVSIENAWETSTMANSARDPYWRAKAAATLKNHPKLK